MALVTAVYEATKPFPQGEAFGLTAQVRRSAISIPSNIAEGFGRQAAGDYIRFLTIARGSLFELETQLEIAFNLDLLAGPAYSEMSRECREISRMLSSLITKIRSTDP